MCTGVLLFCVQRALGGEASSKQSDICVHCQETAGVMVRRFILYPHMVFLFPVSIRPYPEAEYSRPTSATHELHQPLQDLLYPPFHC